MRRACKVDLTQAAIVAALREAGATVRDLSQAGRGFPDLCVGYGGINYLIECKSPGGKLTPDQCVMHATWLGKIHIVRSPQEAISVIQT